ncbi:MAG: PQQ-binding-like beta-propeller repeat protein [Rubripirellula sp.]
MRFPNCRLQFAFIAAVLPMMAVAGRVSAQEWRAWRGPTLDNHAPAEADKVVPTTWSETQNVLWKSAIPGKGHATPIVVGDGVFVLTHEPNERTISLLKYSVSDGKPTGKVVLHRGVEPPSYLHKKNTCASGTPSSDGRLIYVAAQVGDAIYASAVSVQGQIVWQRVVAPYRAGKGWFGYGSSPLLLDDAVVIPVDTDNRDAGLFALNKVNGMPKWRGERPLSTSYSSPILATIAGRPQVLISGGYRVASYDPRSGGLNWKVNATSRTTCATMVWNENMAFASGSYPDSGTFGIAVTAQGGRLVWENRIKCYEQSMLVVGDYLYGIADSGVAYCWRCADGEEMWRSRLSGPFSASPMLVGDRIYASNERGTTYVFRASPDGFESLAENKLGDSSFASPIYADQKLILRHASSESGQREEFLVAIGAAPN